MKTVFSFFVFCLLSSTSLADGKTLLRGCSDFINSAQTKSDPLSPVEAGYCAGFISGMSDMNTFYYVKDQGNALVCMPEGLTKLHKIELVNDYLKRNPDMWSKQEGVVIFYAFHEAYPCSQ